MNEFWHEHNVMFDGGFWVIICLYLRDAAWLYRLVFFQNLLLRSFFNCFTMPGSHWFYSKFFVVKVLLSRTVGQIVVPSHILMLLLIFHYYQYYFSSVRTTVKNYSSLKLIRNLWSLSLGDEKEWNTQFEGWGAGAATGIVVMSGFLHSWWRASRDDSPISWPLLNFLILFLTYVLDT